MDVVVMDLTAPTLQSRNDLALAFVAFFSFLFSRFDDFDFATAAAAGGVLGDQKRSRQILHADLQLKR